MARPFLGFSFNLEQNLSKKAGIIDLCNVICRLYIQRLKSVFFIVFSIPEYGCLSRFVYTFDLEFFLCYKLDYRNLGLNK